MIDGRHIRNSNYRDHRWFLLDMSILGSVEHDENIQTWICDRDGEQHGNRIRNGFGVGETRIRRDSRLSKRDEGSKRGKEDK